MNDKIQSVRDKIQRAFEKARVPDVTHHELELELISDEALDALVTKIPNLPPRGHASHAMVGRHRAVCYRIKVPKADAATLIDRAVKAMKKK